MESFAATITLFLVFLLLSGGGVVALAGSDCEPTTFPVCGAANQLAAAAASACTTHFVHMTTGGTTTFSGPRCDAPLMASQLTQLCNLEMDVPGALCCAAILITVDADCLCRVAEAAEFDVSDLSVSQVWEWYKSCGGRRRSVPRDKSSCEPGSAPPPPPAAKPEAPSAWPLRLAVGLLCGAAIATGIFVALKLWLQQIIQAPKPTKQGQKQGQDLGQDQDVSDPAMTGVSEPQMTCGCSPGDVRSRDGEDAANAIATEQKTSGSGEEDASPRLWPLHDLGTSQVAQARLPSPTPFEPLPPPPPP